MRFKIYGKTSLSLMRFVNLKGKLSLLNSFFHINWRMFLSRLFAPKVITYEYTGNNLLQDLRDYMVKVKVLSYRGIYKYWLARVNYNIRFKINLLSNWEIKDRAFLISCKTMQEGLDILKKECEYVKVPINSYNEINILYKAEPEELLDVNAEFTYGYFEEIKQRNESLFNK